MSSSELRRGNGQSGQSIVEAAVAAMLLGIGVVTGITALDTAIGGSKEATHQAWATCAVRAQTAAIDASPWHANYDYNRMNNITLIVDSDTGSGSNELQVLTISAHDPNSGAVLATADVFKANALTNTSAADPQPYNSPTAFGQWCDYLLK